MATKKPNKNRFLDAAREVRDFPSNTYNQAISDLRDKAERVAPNATKVYDSVAKRGHGLDTEHLANALNSTPKEGIKDLGRLAEDLPPRSLAASASNAKRSTDLAKSLAKKKKWFLGGLAGLGIAAPLLMFFFWMMLFKNVHIKNLYLTYRWAQFNRGINKSLKGALDEAKNDPEKAPKGDPETKVDLNDPPDKIFEGVNEETVKPTTDSEPLAAEAEKVAQAKTEVSPTEQLFKSENVERSLPPIDETGKTQAEIDTANRASLEDDIGEPSKKLKGKASDPIQEGVNEADELTKDGKTTPADAAAKASDGVLKGTGSKGISAEALRTAQGAGVALTFYCIFRDIYQSLKTEVNKVVIASTINYGEVLNKTASAQQIGKTDLNRAGALSKKYDDGKTSFTESCGYTRATQTSNPNCKEINPQFTVNWLVRAVGPAGIGVRTADRLFDPPKTLGVAALAEGSCKIINSTAGQLAIGAVGIAGFIVSDSGWAEAGKAIATGVGVAASSAGGKALIAHAILLYGGKLYNAVTPDQAGNITDMAGLATASGSCQKSYCVPVSPAKAAELDQQYRKERIAANSKRSIFKKLFDTNSTDSVLVRVALNSPATPQAAIGRIRNVFAAISNPLKLNVSLGSTAIAMTTTSAYAATDNGASVYGLEKANYVPPNVAYGYSYKEVNDWAKARNYSFDDEAFKKIDDCIAADNSYQDAAVEDGKNCDPGNNVDAQKYMQYKFQQKTVGWLALRYNNQTVPGEDSSSDSSTDSSSSTAGPNVPVDAERSIDTSAKTCPTGTTDAGTGPAPGNVTIRLCDVGGNIKVNVSIATNYYNMVQAAKTDGVTLAAGGGGYRDTQEQIALRIQHCGGNNYHAIYEVSAGSCRPPTAKPGTGNHEYGLAVDFASSSTRSTAVYQWLAGHAATFKIYNLPSEPWHWSFNGR